MGSVSGNASHSHGRYLIINTAMFGSITSKILIGQFVVMLVMAAGGYLYFKHSQSVIGRLTEEKTRLEISVREQEATILAQREAAARQNTESLRLQQSLVDAESQRRTLESRLRARNLEAMARANSADLERRINRATIEAFRDIENLTGSGRLAATANGQSRSVTADRNPREGSQSSDAGNIPTNYQPPPRPPARRSETEQPR